MRTSKTQLAADIDRLMIVKAKIAHDVHEIELLTTFIKKAGGGESSMWRAELVKMPKKVMIVKAHKQLRVYEKQQ